MHFNAEGVKEADIWFVIDAPPSYDLACRTGAVVYVGAEVDLPLGAWAESRAMRNYLGQFDRVLTSQDYIAGNSVFSPPFLPWMINSNHGTGVFAPHQRDRTFLAHHVFEPKERLISVFCSDKQASARHRSRFRFVEALASELGPDLDWFGNGVRPLEEKWEGIAPYRFHIALENQSSYGVFTEAIFDAYLGNAFPLYWGAPDLSEYFPSGSFVALNLSDIRGSLSRILDAISRDLDSVRAVELSVARDKVLCEWNMFERLSRLAAAVAATGTQARSNRQIAPPPRMTPWVNHVRDAARVRGQRLRTFLQPGQRPH